MDPEVPPSEAVRVVGEEGAVVVEEGDEGSDGGGRPLRRTECLCLMVFIFD